MNECGNVDWLFLEDKMEVYIPEHTCDVFQVKELLDDISRDLMPSQNANAKPKRDGVVLQARDWSVGWEV